MCPLLEKAPRLRRPCSPVILGSKVLSLLATMAIVTPLVVPARSHDISLALRDMPVVGAAFFPDHDEPDQTVRSTPPRLGFDPVLQGRAFLSAPSPSISFDGIGPATRTGNANPPDANAAIG